MQSNKTHIVRKISKPKKKKKQTNNVIVSRILGARTQHAEPLTMTKERKNEMPFKTLTFTFL